MSDERSEGAEPVSIREAAHEFVTFHDQHGFHVRHYERLTPDSEWRETYSRDFTRFGWRVERARRWLRRLFR